MLSRRHQHAWMDASILGFASLAYQRVVPDEMARAEMPATHDHCVWRHVGIPHRARAL